MTVLCVVVRGQMCVWKRKVAVRIVVVFERLMSVDVLLGMTDD